MSTNEIKITTEDKNITVVAIPDNELSIDRISSYLIKCSFASILGGVTDGTPVMSKSIKDILIKEVEKK